jgi:hypothetical protein
MTTITKMLRQQQEHMAAYSGKMWKNGGGFRLLVLLLLCGMTIALVFPVTAQESLTRGNRFTVSIAAKPNTAYYVWFTRTFAMSGEPGDQPPLIAGNTERVEFDPAGGPYVIGSYQFRNGNGKTILDDVAPSSAAVSNTRYYAKVTTDENGYGILQFTTSSATAPRTFSIRAENPASPEEEVPVRLGLPEKTTAITPAKTTAPSATTAAVLLIPTPPPLVNPPVAPAIQSTLPEPSAVPTVPQQAPTVALMVLLGLGLSALLRRF